MTLEDIQSSIKNKPAILLYFSGENCGVCKALQPKIKKAFDTNFPKIEQIYLDIEKYKNIAIDYSVFSMPTILIFLDGKEFARESRNLSVDALVQRLKRPYNLFFN